MIASMILPGNAGNRTQYLLGRFDGSAFQATLPFEQPEWVDIGYNNYAPVTFFGSPEPIALGWANCWAYADRLPTGDYAGMMTLPRRLALTDTRRGLRLTQNPVRQLDAATGPWRAAGDGASLPGECFRLRIEGRAPYALTLTNGEEALCVHLTGDELRVDLRQAGECGAANQLRSERYGLLRGERLTGDDSLELVFDVCIAEIFADGGARCATAPVFPTHPYTHLRLEGAASAYCAML